MRIRFGALVLTLLSLVATPSAATTLELVFEGSFELPMASGLFGVDAMSFDPATGNLIISDGGTSPAEITTSGVFVRSIPYTADSSGPDGLQALPLANGNFLAGTDSRFVEFDQTTGEAVPGGISLDVENTPPAFLDTIGGITFDPDSQTLWAVSDSFGMVVSYGTDGSFQSEFFTTILSPPLLGLEGIVYDPVTGDLLIVDDQEDSLNVFTTGGTLLDSFDLEALGGIDRPQAVTIDPATRTVYAGGRTTVGIFSLVPEPSTVLLIGAGLTGLARLRRRA